MNHEEKKLLIEKLDEMLERKPFVIEYLNKIDNEKREKLFRTIDFASVYSSYDKFYECFEKLSKTLQSGTMDHASYDLLNNHVHQAIHYAEELFFDHKSEEEIAVLDVSHEKALLKLIDVLIPHQNEPLASKSSSSVHFAYSSMSSISSISTSRSENSLDVENDPKNDRDLH